MLLAASADPALHDGDHETALQKAALDGHHAVVVVLGVFATEDDRNMARAMLRAHRESFDPDAYAGPDQPVSEWKRAAAGVFARVTRLFGDEHATKRLERVKRSEVNAGVKVK